MGRQAGKQVSTQTEQPTIAPSVTLANNLRKLGGYWRILNELLGHNESAARGGTREGRIPINGHVLDTMRAIEGFTNTHARQLTNDDHTWRRPVGGYDLILNALADRVGHFNIDMMAREVKTLGKQARAIAIPDGQTNIPLGIPCFTEECPGEMRVPIDRDHPIPETGLTLWRPAATCSTDPSHQCDARLLAHASDTP